MQAYLIDPVDMTVEAVEYNGDFHQIYEFIDATAFDLARFNAAGDAVFVDDEGLVNGQHQHFFVVDGYPQPLAGKGLVLGVDQEGDSVTPSVSLEQMRKMVTFVFPISAGGKGLLWAPIPGGRYED